MNTSKFLKVEIKACLDIWDRLLMAVLQFPSRTEKVHQP